jgi:predicted PurR-regulated permease PerM
MSKLVHSAFERHSMQRFSGFLAIACLVFIVVLPIVVLAYWAVADAGLLAARSNLLPSNIQAPLQDWQRLVGALLTCIPVALMLRGLWEARLCFKQFAHGHIFTEQAARRLRSFAGWTMTSSLASILIVPLLSIVLTFNNTPGTRQISVGIGTDHVFTLLFAAMVWVMAAVISQGQALAEENASFI